MILLYLENSSKLLSIKREEALPALKSQVLEIFSKINSIENAVLGLFVDASMEIRIQSYNKYIWKVEVMDLLNYKLFLYYYSTQRVQQLIQDIFKV